MARARMFAVHLGAALLSLSLAPLAFAQDTAVQPTTENAVPGLLEQFGVDIQPSAALSVEQLETRIKELVAVLEQNGLTNDAKKQLRAQLKADRGELKQRQAMAEGQPATTEESQEQAPEQPVAATGQPADATVEKQPEPSAEGQPVAETAQPADATVEKQTEPSAEGQPVAASPEQTNDPAAEMTPKKQVPLDQAETDAAAPQLAAPSDVDAPLKVNPQAETRALALLADTTSIDSLSNAELKARIEEYRDLLREPELSPKTAKALRQRLKVDRETLRVRVAEQNVTQTEAQAALAQQLEQQVQPAQEQTQQLQPATTQNKQDLKKELKAAPVEPAVTAVPRSTLALLRVAPLLPTVTAPTAQEIPLILEDQRPAHALAVDELSRRILAARQALQDNQLYSENALQQFRQQLQADRTDLSDRLLADRNQRADIYDQFEQADDLDFVNGNESDSGVLQPLNSIFAAEVNDDEMWNQLLSSPLGPIQQRYTRQEVMQEPEIVMNLPEVRETMPSIELDTIAFGFNEAFMREEEIFDLDRIARMIERVVAAHPDEIFMIEGHTDAVGSDAYNLILSRQRAEAVAAALTRYYVIKPENLATVGLGERYLRIWTPEAEEENRRVTVRRVTPLMQGYEGAG